MKTWKLVSGILSMVLSGFVFFQSAAVGLGNALAESSETSGSFPKDILNEALIRIEKAQRDEINES